MDFNKAQMTALEHRDGPMMVLAGPGSGKTTVITHRIKRLLEAGVDPSGILVITFTKAAAAEMKERFLRLVRLFIFLPHQPEKPLLHLRGRKMKSGERRGRKMITCRKTDGVCIGRKKANRVRPRPGSARREPEILWKPRAAV